MSTKEKVAVTIDAPASLVVLRPIRMLVRELLDQWLSVEEHAEFVDDMELVFSEAFTNICRHAYPDRDGEIRVTVELDSNRLELRFEDTGVGFDPESVPDPDPASPGVSGYGWCIIREKTDRWSYYSDGRGRNFLELSVRLPQGR